MARAVAAFKSVIMVAAPGQGAVAQEACGPDIEVIELPLDDSWMRDTGPFFAFTEDGRRVGGRLPLQRLGREAPPLGCR